MTDSILTEDERKAVEEECKRFSKEKASPFAHGKDDSLFDIAMGVEHGAEFTAKLLKDKHAAEIKKLEAGWVSAVDTLTKGLKERNDQITQLKAENERQRMQLAACGVAAMQNTENTRKDRIDRTNEFFCQSYMDVCNAVDREMKLQSEITQLKAENEKLRRREARDEPRN